MKITFNFFLLTFVFQCFNLVGQEKITSRANIFLQGHATIEVSDSNCLQPYNIHIDFKDKIFVFGIRPCSGNKIKGDLLLELIYNKTIYFFPIKNINDQIFNYSNYEIVTFFKKLSKTDLIKYQDFTKTINQEFYEEKEEQKRLEAEQIESEKQKMILEKEKTRKQKILEKCYNDSVLAKKENNRLIEDQKGAQIGINKIGKEIEKGKTFGILLSTFEVIDNGYGRIDLELEILNCSNKKIKYISFKVKALNPVGDPVGSVETVKGIGFIEPLNSGSWTFESVWYSDVIEKVKILSITITFEDGTTKIINEIEKIITDLSSELLSDFSLHSEIGRQEIVGAITLYRELGFISFSDVSDISDKSGTLVIDQLFISDLKTIIEYSKNEDEYSEVGVFKILRGCDNIYITDPTNGSWTLLSIEDTNKLLTLIFSK